MLKLVVAATLTVWEPPAGASMMSDFGAAGVTRFRSTTVSRAGAGVRVLFADAQLYALAQSLAADDARCLSGHAARPKHAAAILQLVRNGTATNLVTISDDESGLPAFRVSRRGKWKAQPEDKKRAVRSVSFTP